MTEDEMVGWHHRLYGHEFEQVLGVGDGQRSLACCSPWGRKESDTTERLKGTELTECSRLPHRLVGAWLGRGRSASWGWIASSGSGRPEAVVVASSI